MSNKSVGTRFEREMAEILAAHGFWVHRFQDNQNGQPCDLIACRDGRAWLIDCKDCQGDSFLLRRMEENQRNAMELFQHTGNAGGIFAVRFGKEIFMIPYQALKKQESAGVRRMGRFQCAVLGMSLGYWLGLNGAAAVKGED